jgi:hypothetical protein
MAQTAESVREASPLKRAGKAALGACGFGVSMCALLAPGLTGRRVVAQLVKAAGSAALRLKPSIYESLDAGNAEFATGERVRRPILQRRALAATMERAEAGEITLEQALEALDIPPEARAEAAGLRADEVFAGMPPDIEVAVQYSGGGDSTLAGLLAATYFKRVHLLTGAHPFINGPRVAAVNARKLVGVFGPDKVTHAIVDTTRALREILFGSYWKDLREYGTLPIADGCLCCKLSFDVGMVTYAREHNVGAVMDGADLMIKFQLSQGHPEIMKLREEFYGSRGLSFVHPCASISDGATMLLLLGLAQDPPVLLYPSQPTCRGYDFLGQVSKRYYFLPRYGMDGLTEVGVRYAKDKLAVCAGLLDADESCVSIEGTL